MEELFLFKQNQNELSFVRRDTSRLEIPVASVKAHETIINMIDGCGGATRPGGPHELATCSRDGNSPHWKKRRRILLTMDTKGP